MKTNVCPIIDREDYKLTISIYPLDGRMDKSRVVIETVVFDGYHGRWLEPRKTQLFLTKEEISRIGEMFSLHKF